MMKLLLLCLLLGASYVSGQDEFHESLEEFEEEFKQFTTDEELAKEWEENLEKAEEEINQQNEKFNNGESTFFEELNEMSELSQEEFEKEKTGYMSGGDENRKFATGLVDIPMALKREISMRNKDFFEQYSNRQNPSSIDSEADGFVTPVKNQANCGSCAAFTATSVMETCLLTQGASMDGLDLAEQDLLDCGYNPDRWAYGCDGAWIGSYTEFMVDKNDGSMAHEQGYPYKTKRGDCQQVPNYSTSQKAYAQKYTGSCSEDQMMALVNEFGSVGTSLAADGPFMNYGGGVFDGCMPESKINPAVVVVGYGTENGVDFWKVKNSWGTWWGENGYIRLKRGVGMCRIGTECVIMDCNPPASEGSSGGSGGSGAVCDTNQWNDYFGGYPLDGYVTLFYGGEPKYLTCEDGMCGPDLDMISWSDHACQYICDSNNCGGEETRSVLVERR